MPIRQTSPITFAKRLQIWLELCVAKKNSQTYTWSNFIAFSEPLLYQQLLTRNFALADGKFYFVCFFFFFNVPMSQKKETTLSKLITNVTQWNSCPSQLMATVMNWWVTNEQSREAIGLRSSNGIISTWKFPWITHYTILIVIVLFLITISHVFAGKSFGLQFYAAVNNP